MVIVLSLIIGGLLLCLFEMLAENKRLFADNVRLITENLRFKAAIPKDPIDGRKPRRLGVTPTGPAA